MTKTPKLIVTNGPFEVYRAGHVLIIQRNGEFFCNLRKTDRGFANPEAHIADLISVEAEVLADAAAERSARLKALSGYLAKRADRAAASPTFSF